jgi:hemoglobin
MEGELSMRKIGSIACVILTTASAAGLIAGCADGTGGMHSSAAHKPLFERLGGEKAVTAVVDDFVNRAAGDPKVNFTRKGTPMEWEATPRNVEHLKQMLTQFVCMATGGPQKYEGREMKSVHHGMMISHAEFDALAANLKATLDKFGVPAPEQGELLGIVGTTRSQIVEK